MWTKATKKSEKFGNGNANALNGIDGSLSGVEINSNAAMGINGDCKISA